MSTTTETERLLRRAARATGAALLVMAIWFAGLAVAVVAAEPTRSVVVFGPQDRVLRAVASASARLVDSGSGFVIASGEGTGFVRQLYSAGAWLVLPAMTGGCRGRAVQVAARKD